MSSNTLSNYDSPCYEDLLFTLKVGSKLTLRPYCFRAGESVAFYFLTVLTDDNY